MQRKFISRRSFLKCAGMGAVTAAAADLLAGCGGSDSSSSSTASSAAAAEPADPNKPYAGVTLYYAATDNIPAEQFKAAWFDPTRKVLSEKIVGTADTTISQIWTSEAPCTAWASRIWTPPCRTSSTAPTRPSKRLSCTKSSVSRRDCRRLPGGGIF